MASFANADGGYIIFGVTDSPRMLKGLNSESLRRFEELDPAILTSGLNEYLSPEVRWEAHLHTVENKKIAMIYTQPAVNKPVVVRKNFQYKSNSATEGDIYYRYNSRSERIKFPELNRIIEDAKMREQRAMMKHLERLILAGASNAAVLDFNAKSLQGPTGAKALISQELVDELSFIKEGEFDEVSGAPTIRIVGTAQPTNTISVESPSVRKQAITTEDIIEDFLNQSPGDDALAYVRQIAAGSSGLIPVHFYRVTAGYSTSALIDYVSDINTRAPAKKKLLKRLENNDSFKRKPPPVQSHNQGSVQRQKFYDGLLAGEVPRAPFPSESQALYFLQALMALENEVLSEYCEALLQAVKSCLHDFYSSTGRAADAIRRASSRLDFAMYGDR